LTGTRGTVQFVGAPLTFYHARQIEDFLDAIIEDRRPMVDGEEGRAVVELFTAVYRSQRDGRSICFPLQPEDPGGDFDGRLAHPPFSARGGGAA
jgi:UDP-N-acetyl-2-amino-2-deoxyglucuronate dehydrogenase